MFLDTPTVVFITVLVVCLESGILTALWVIHRNMRGVGYWAAGALAIALGVLGIYFSSGALPSTSLVIANLFVVAGYVLTWWGIEAFFERPVPTRFGAAILGLTAVALAYFAIVGNSRLRITVLLACFALLAALRAYSVLRDMKPSTRFSQILSGTTLAAHCLYNLTLSAAVWASPPVERPLSELPISGWLFLIPMLLSMAVVFAAILLVNQTIAARLQETARRDALTDALTRRALEEVAEDEIARSRRHRTPLSLLLLDIDHFKLVNDQYGHPAGDAALRQFAAAVRHCLRREDIFGRLGGEEFCALLPNTSIVGAAQLAERIRQSVADLAVDLDGSRLSLNVSIGVADFSDHASTWNELMHRADAAMYAAKRAGRNRVMVANTPLSA
jgi:diguanylate cyclase (GGDEF)-like protein